MKLALLFALSIASTTALADLTKQLTAYDQGELYPGLGPIGVRKHLHGTNAPGSGDSVEVYNYGFPRVPIFHAYHPSGLKMPFSAILNSGAKAVLPQAIQEILEANNILNPQINIVFQAVDPTDPMVFRPQYFSHPDAPRDAGQRESWASHIDWLAVKVNAAGAADFSLMPDQPADNRLVNLGGMSFHGTGAGNVVASPDAGEIDLGITQMRRLGFQEFFTVARSTRSNRRSPDVDAVTLHWFLHGALLDDVVQALDETSTVDGFLEHHLIDGVINTQVLGRLRTLVDYVEAGPSRNQPQASAAPTPSSPLDGASSYLLPGNISMAHFWEQNPRARDFALNPPKGEPRFTDGNLDSEYRFILKALRYNKKLKLSRTLPDDIDLNHFWSQNPRVREYGLKPPKGRPRFEEGDRESELAFARLYFETKPDKARWDPSIPAPARILPKNVPLSRFWEQNPGMRQVGLDKGKFRNGEKTRERRWAEHCYRFNPKAKWQP